MRRNMGNQISIGIVAAVLSSGMISYCFSEPNKVDELRERCGKQTEEFKKKQLGTKESSETKDGQTINKYETHYNAKLDKCFYLTMSETIEKNKVKKLERLFSVDENKEYGMFTGGNRDTFTICVLFIRKPALRCSSEDEWRALIRPYMEDAD
jgi:hypothetical protein